MLVPETKSVYIQSRHELGREWECTGCNDPSTPSGDVTWGPIEERREQSDFVIYDGGKRGSEGGTMMGIYFEDTFPDITGNPGECGGYYNEMNVYQERDIMVGTGLLSSIPMEVVQIFADKDAAGAAELSLGVLEIGCNQGRTYFKGLGGRGYPVNVQRNDLIVLRPIWIEGADLIAQNPEAVRNGHTELAVLPVRGNFPFATCDEWVPEVPYLPYIKGDCVGPGWGLCGLYGESWLCYYPCSWEGEQKERDYVPGYCLNDEWSLYNYEGWEKRFQLNVTLDMIETKIVEQILDR